MTITPLEPIRVLVADDEPAVQAAYREVLAQAPDLSGQTLARLRARVLAHNGAPPSRAGLKFEVVFCSQAEAAVAAVRDAVARDRPFAMVFLDMRMPPGRDGGYAAREIRALDPHVEIILCSAYTDVDPASIALEVPPENKIFFVEKPFHPFEIRQLATALGAKWHAERELARLAYIDSLTGLANRTNFRRRLAAAIDTAGAATRPLALICLDLDNFKRINDTLGHAAGDEMLCLAAERLRRSLRSAELRGVGDDPNTATTHIARLGGDEFVILLTGIGGAAQAAVIADRILRVLNEPMRLGSHSVLVTASLGIALYPTDASSADDLYRQADLAMYFAKQQGAGRFAFYDPSMGAGALKRLTLETKLRDALQLGEFTLHYQPQFDLNTGMICGMEALLRWRNAEVGAVPPQEFIPIAEETGLILPIGEWVLRTACIQQREWLDEGLPAVRVAVNVSACQFARADFPALVESVLRETGLDPAALELEITESVIMQNDVHAMSSLAALKALGVSLAIDDFGTGYSSLSRLREFPVDRLKVDRSFVRHITTRSSDQTIAEAIIAMAKALKLVVVAEGVEDFAQLLHLQEQQCHLAQGFLLSRPLPAEEATDFLVRVSGQPGTRTQRFRSLAT
jgi:diguanylate cyclase (GGDEF)-like protein